VLGLTAAGGDLPTWEALRDATAELWRLYWAGRYAELARDLPARIGHARAFASADGETRTAYALLAELLQMTASLLAHLAHEDLAHLALAEADRAAQAADDALLAAGMQATRSWVLSRQGLWSEAEQVAVTAAAGIEPSMRPVVTGTDDYPLTDAWVWWTAERVVRQHDEPASPDRVSVRCAQCRDDGCELVAWARAVIADRRPPASPGRSRGAGHGHRPHPITRSATAVNRRGNPEPYRQRHGRQPHQPAQPNHPARGGSAGQ